MGAIHIFAVLLAGGSAVLVCGQSQPGFAVSFIVPSDSTNQDGNTYSFFPVIMQPFTMRYQQVYAASEFSSLTNYGGGWISQVVFRGDATNGTQVGVTMKIQVNFSTALRGPDELSPVFADNVGVDDTVVFSGNLQTEVLGNTSGRLETFTSFAILQFSRFFYYNPTAGNLLLDIRVIQGNTNTNIFAVLDAWDRTNDSVSRVRGELDATTGFPDTIGLATRLIMYPNPKLTVQQDKNSVTLVWPANPESFMLEKTENLAQGPNWQAITADIIYSSNRLTKSYTVPLETGGAAGFFRLISGTTGAPP